MASLQAIKYERGTLDVLDQLKLPHEHHYDEVSTCEEAFDCIKSMRVRGAPAIAIVAALALAVELHRGACSQFTRSLAYYLLTHIYRPHLGKFADVTHRSHIRRRHSQIHRRAS